MTGQAARLRVVDPGGVDPQERVARLRAGLLGGRGPGASATELAERQHQRREVGALVVTVERERVSLRAGVARGDLGADVTARRATAGRDVAAPPGRRPEPTASRGRTPVLAPFALGVLLGAAGAGTVRGWCRARRGGG